jgi:exodeoxyribonuclease V beta subunit
LAQSADLQRWLSPFADEPRSAVQQVPEATEQQYLPRDCDEVEARWRVPQRSAAEHWWIASYSALRMEEGEVQRPGRYDDAAPDSPAMQNSTDDEKPALLQAPMPVSAQGLHRFPRGPNPGTFLHGLLELAAVEGFGHLASTAQQLRELLARRCQRRGLQNWIDPLHQWMQTLLVDRLRLGDGRSVSLAELNQYQPELEFWFEASQVDVLRLDELVQRFELPGVPRQPLCADTLNGMFKGFIDLVFEHEGRYYVVDYKSNWLGIDEASYTQEMMTAAVASHRYDLQYVLYVLALHRQLRVRLPDYDYERHLGGALYLFLRAPATGTYLAKPPRELIDQLDALFQAEPGEVAA